MYDSMEFRLSFTFPSNYPFTAPTVKFVTSCFHPNVDTAGNICLDILKVGNSRLFEISWRTSEIV